MKSWLWVHDLCQIFTYFSFDLKQSLSNHFFMIFTSKIFFYFKSYKKITRSRLELVLRASFVINSKNSWKYFFHIFHIKKILLLWMKREGYKIQLRAGFERFICNCLKQWIKILANLFRFFTHQKHFFIADQTRSKWEPVLRDTFKIVSNAPLCNFLPIILSCFTGKNILFV